MTDENSKLTDGLMRTLWPSFKRQLRARLPAEAEEDWIRSMYLLRAIRASSDQVHLLATLPPNGRIQAAAVRRLPLMRGLLAPSFNISLTSYPDEYTVSEARRRYGIDLAPKPWRAKSAPQPEANG